MAIIFTYPTKATPALTDTVIITDSESEDPEDRTKQISIASIKTTMGVVDGTGTANTIPKWSDSNTLTDSPFTIDTSINSLDIPTFIRHIGDTDSQFGFQADNHFRVKTGGQTTIQSISRTDENGNTGQVAGLYFNSSQRFFTRTDGVEVEGSLFMPGYIKHLGDNDSFFGFSIPNNFILNTDSGEKIKAGPDSVTLYSDTSLTATTTSFNRLNVNTTGVVIYGQTAAAGAPSDQGGLIKYYNDENNRYVGISGPITTGTSYQVRLPDSVGEAGQVLKLNTPIIGGSTQDLVWGDAAGVTYTAGINISISGTNVISATNTTYTTATSGTLGLVKIGFPESGKNYPVELLNDQMFVNVPWTDTGTTYSASTGLTLTGTVFSANTVGTQSNLANNASSVAGRSYPIQTGAASGTVGSDHLIVNIPWTDNNTTYTAGANVSISGTNVISASASSLNVATSAVLGGIKSHLNYGAQVTVNPITSTSSRFYGVVINDDDKAMVNVPWTDTNTTYTGGTDIGINVSNVISHDTITNTGATASSTLSAGGTFTAINSVTVSAQGHLTGQTVETYTLPDDIDTGLTSVTYAVGTGQTTPLSSTITGRALEITSNKYGGTNQVGYVPEGGTAVDFLRGDGTWVTPTNTTYSTATSGTLGLVKIGYTQTATRDYPVTLNSEKMLVTVPWTDTIVTASQGLTKTSNNITLDIADPTTGWAILGGGAGASTPVILGYAGANATGNKNYGISSFINSSTVTSADQNVAVGFASMGTTVSTASRNVVVGFEAGESMTTSNDSVLIGQDAGEAITTGGENTIIGSNAGETITTGSRNTIIGSGAIAGTGSASVFSVVVGRDASATSSSVAVGSGAIVAGATGIAVGDQAGTASTALNGIALGKGAQATLQGTVGNVAIGSSANPVSLAQPEEFSASFEYLNVTINGDQYYIRLYKSGE